MQRFFSGFGFKNEKELFNEFLNESNFCVAGFSYGAQKAIKYALQTDDRIDLIQLFSPAFFDDKSDSFKKAQLFSYSKDSIRYMQSFYQKISRGLDLSKFFGDHSKEELKELLEFRWEEPLKEVLLKDIEIEVFLGKEDEIINSNKALELFSKYGSVYFFKDRGHLLVCNAKVIL